MSRRSMDVTFYTDDGDKGFVVEIGFFDTVAEIKEKVQFFAGYPVASQKLVFNGQELRDDADTERCGILHNSSVQILVASDPSCAKEEDDGDALDQTVKVNVFVSRSSPDRRLSLEASACDTVHRLKARIGDLEGIMMQGLALHRQGEGEEEEEEGEELLDHHTLSDYMAAGEVEVTVHTAARPPLSGLATPAPADPYSRSLRLVVRPMFRPAPTKKMLTTVNPSRKVNDLGRVMREKFGVHWPSEGCFLFVRNHVAMDEGKSFRWHGVEEDETIEIFRVMDD